MVMLFDPGTAIRAVSGRAGGWIIVTLPPITQDPATMLGCDSAGCETLYC